MKNFLRNIFSEEEVNTSRQFEFDVAKTVCIVFMVLIHAFERLTTPAVEKSSVIYYVVVIVLDVFFAASIFMQSMGLGIVYGKKKEYDEYIRRGFKLFLAGYVLNIFRAIVHYVFEIFAGLSKFSIGILISSFLSNDILQFAGLALILFGWLKKHNCSDLVLFFIALGMSIAGSVLRFIDLNNPIINQIVGLFIGTTDNYLKGESIDASAFPLLNWFIVVVAGYLYAKLLRCVKDIEKYYAISLPLSAIPLIIYMIIAIPKRIGMMSEDINYYYFFSTPNILILFIAMLFATSFYHYILKLLSESIKSNTICISNNLTSIYFYQWMTMVCLDCIFMLFGNFKFSNDIAIIIVGIILCMISIILGTRYSNWIKKLTN